MLTPMRFALLLSTWAPLKKVERPADDRAVIGKRVAVPDARGAEPALGYGELVLAVECPRLDDPFTEVLRP